MKGVDATAPIRYKRRAWRNERSTVRQGAIQRIKKEYLPWPSVF
jgi:hypothetical protein